MGNEEVNEAERNGDAFAAGEDLVEEAVEWIGVVLGVAVKTVFVKEHAVDDATFFAGGHGFGEEFAAAGGEGIELLAAGSDIDPRENGAVEQDGAGFEFVVEGANEADELGGGVAEFQFFEKPAGVPGEGTIFASSDGF